MGLLDDLAMGFGLKERTRDYDARTARNIAVSEAAGNWGGSKGYSMSPAMMMKESRIRDRGNYDTGTGQARAFLTRQGGNDPSYNPQIVQDDRPLSQRALFSPQDQLSPTPVAIGPMTFQQPLRLPGILGMITSGLFGPREVPTVSAPSGPMRGRPSDYQAPTGLTDDDMGLPGVPVPDIRLKRTAGTYTTPYEIGNSGLGMDYVARPPRSVLDITPEMGPGSMTVGMAPTAAETTSNPAYPKELAELYSEAALDQMMPEAIEYLKSIHGLDDELTPITTGPHAGKFMDASGRLVRK